MTLNVLMGPSVPTYQDRQVDKGRLRDSYGLMGVTLCYILW